MQDNLTIIIPIVLILLLVVIFCFWKVFSLPFRKPICSALVIFTGIYAPCKFQLISIEGDIVIPFTEIVLSIHNCSSEPDNNLLFAICFVCLLLTFIEISKLNIQR